MSEFIAEAKVIVRPDTSRFRQELREQVRRIAREASVAIPVTFAAAGGAGVAAATAATAALSAAQAKANVTALGLTFDEDKLTRSFGAQAVILEKLTADTLRQKGAQDALDRANKKGAASLLGVGTAAGKLDAGLLGLRTALGSAAVIGLGAVALAAIAAGKALRASVVNFAEFEQELNTFGAVTGATAEQMEEIRKTAIALGQDVQLPGVSAADAAIALTELSKAGLTVEESIAGVEGVLQLATAAQISNADAALIAANALNSFGLEGTEAVRVADTLANAANAAQGSITDFGLALRQSSAVARQVGLSLEDTTAILSLFAKNGLQGSDAGTSLRVALIRLVAPTKAAAAEIARLGLDIRDAQGNLRADIFAQFGEATRDLSPAVRDASAALIFGQDAIRAVSIGAREGTEGLRLMQFQIDQQGTAAEIAAARTTGLAGALNSLKNAGEGLSITFGKLLSGPLGQTAKNFAIVASSIDRLIQSTEGLGPATLDQNSRFDQLSGHLRDIAKTVLVPGEGFKKLALLLDSAGRAALETQKQFEGLNAELQLLQDVRVLLAEGDQFGLAEGITPLIKGVREQIVALEREAQGLSAIPDPLQDALTVLQQIRDIRLDKGLNTAVIDKFIRSLERQIQVSGQATIKINDLPDGITRVGITARETAAGVDALTAAMKRLTQASTVLSDQLQKAQAEGASPQSQIALLQEDNATQRAIIAQAEKGGRQRGDITAIRKARDAIIANNAEIEALQNEIKSEAEAGARSAKEKSDAIADAQEDATRSFIDAFDPRKQKILNQVAGAALTERLSDDLKFQKILVAFLKNQIDAIKDRIRRLGLQGAALKAARDAIAAITKEINNILLDIQKDQQAAIKRTQDIINQRLDFKIQIAQAQDNTAAEIRARRAKLAQITKELVAAKKEFGKNSLQWLELKAAQAEQIAAIKELENQNKTSGEDARKSAAEFFFSQLQAQQGFASNLLGNLIPANQTSGLVGIPSAPPQPGDGISIAASAAAGKGDRGPTSGQVASTNDILLRILAQLKELNGEQKNPEAQNQRKKQMAVMDYEHGQGGAM